MGGCIELIRVFLNLEEPTKRRKEQCWVIAADFYFVFVGTIDELDDKSSGEWMQIIVCLRDCSSIINLMSFRDRYTLRKHK